jgi:hypothetical protein
VTSKKTIGLGDQAHGLYRLVVNGTHPTIPTLDSQLLNKTVNLTCTSSHVNATSVIPLSALWHFRLGHLSHRRLSHMSQLYPTIVVDNKAACDVCHYAKQKKLSFPVSTSHSSSKYEMLHFDIWDPLSIASVHNHKFFLTIVDDYSRYTWIILLKSKAEVSSHIQNFITSIQTQFHITPKIIRSDNGPEFLLHSFYASHGILHHKSCVETPQQNGRVERKHQHLLNVGRALLFQSKLPKSFWSYAVLYATFLINRVPTPLLNHKSPYQLLHDSIPDKSVFKVFGSLCYASSLNSHRTKLDSRARKSVFLGDKSGYKGFVLYDLNTKEIFISRHVTFHEHILPYQSSNPSFTNN